MEETFFLTLTTNSFYFLSYLLLSIWWAHKSIHNSGAKFLAF